MSIVLTAGLAAMALVLAWPAAVRRPRPAVGAPPPPSGDWLRRGRWLWAASAGTACWTFLSGWPGLVVGLLAALAVRHLAVTAEPSSLRRERLAVRAELPLLVLLLATTLRAGATPAAGVRRVCAALPGAAASRLLPVPDRLALGIDPVTVWDGVARDPDLATLGRAMARAQRSGAPVAATVERLADELAAAGRAQVEDRARAVGVKAALPLGLCLLPSFLLLGIVPMVAGLAAGLGL